MKNLNIINKNDIRYLFDDNKFIATRIKKYILSKKWIEINKNINKVTNLVMYFPVNENENKYNYKKIVNEVSKIIKKTNKILIKMDGIIPHNLNITIFYLDKEKKLPKQGIALGTYEFNSGSTTIKNNDIDILIWRSNELNKVLIHELIHAYKVDKNIYNVDKREAYTECLALHIFNYINSKNTKDYFKKMENEKIHSIQLLSKILHQQNIHIDKNKLNNKNYLEYINKKLSKETAIYGYVYLKSLFLYNNKKEFYDNLNKEYTRTNKNDLSIKLSYYT